MYTDHDESRIDLLEIREKGGADWLGRVTNLKDVEPKLNRLSRSSDNQFIAVDRATGAVVAHVVGRKAS
jgi:hypothetical protein